MHKHNCTCQNRSGCPVTLPICRRCFAALPTELQQKWSELSQAWAKLDELRQLRRTIRAYNSERLHERNLA